MNNAPVEIVKVPKADALVRLAKNLAAVRVEQVAAQARLKAAVSPDKYALHFQLDAFKKQAHFFKAQIARIKKEPQAEVIWSDRFGA